jgi:hypothetical protein
METTNQKTVVLEEDDFELENCLEEDVQLEDEDFELEICGEVEPPKPPKKKKEIKLDEIKPGQLIRTYTIKHLLQKGVLTFSKWDPERGLYFDRNIVKEDPGFVEAMRSCFGKKLEVLEVSEMLNCVVVEDPENRNYKWHLPLECVRYHYKRYH